MLEICKISLLLLTCFFTFYTYPSSDTNPITGMSPVPTDKLTTKPYSQIGIVETTFKNGSNLRCTGTLIDSNSVFVDAHCVTNVKQMQKADVDSIYFYLGSKSYLAINSAHFPKEWSDSHTSHLALPDYDYSIITLTTHIPDYAPIKLKEFPTPTPSNYSTEVILAGYPGTETSLFEGIENLQLFSDFSNEAWGEITLADGTKERALIINNPQLKKIWKHGVVTPPGVSGSLLFIEEKGEWVAIGAVNGSGQINNSPVMLGFDSIIISNIKLWARY